MMSKMHVFGTLNPDVEYKPRPAAYAVIRDGSGRIAAVKGSGGYFLPGGGSLAGETREQTVAREVREELAREVRIVRRIGEVVQYFCADGQDYRMEAVFFAAEFASEASGVGEHELYWLEREQLQRAFFHKSHAWACEQLKDIHRPRRQQSNHRQRD
jgi:8-oxo-dGTP diphosphatase